MAIARDMSKAQISFQVTGRDLDEFDVLRYRGTEGLCQLYKFEIDVASHHESADFDGIVGKPAAMSIATGHGVRWFHGIVSRLEVTGAFIAAEADENRLSFRIHLVPSMWYLTQRYTSRIFQNKSVVDIIKEVLTDAGLLSNQFDLTNLQRTYEPREYCVQYRESDYNVVARLAEEEGIWWYFEQSPESHLLKMEDKSSAYVEIEDESSIAFAPPQGMVTDDEHVHRFRMARSVRPGRVVLSDYSFESPDLNLETLGTNELPEHLEHADYPGGYRTQGVGRDLADIRAQEFKASHHKGVGVCNSIRIGPARKFELTNHPISSLNASYVVTAMTHEGKQSIGESVSAVSGRTGVLGVSTHQSILAARGNDDRTIRDLADGLLEIAARMGAGDVTARRELTEWVYHDGLVMTNPAGVAGALGERPLTWVTLPNVIDDVARDGLINFDAPVYTARFECIPSELEFRPPRVTPRPKMSGPQSARVVGPDSEEIQVDEFGRVKVQFNWDRVGNEGGQLKLHGADSSCWIRVCQGSVGGQYGMMFIPRIGQEVLVDFMDGNPDCPVIVGRLNNRDHMPPYTLPEHKTRSVIKTHSTKGGGGTNEIRFEDLKGKEQLFLQAQRQMDTRVKGSHFHTAGGSYHLLVGGENNGALSGEYRQTVHKAKHVHVKGDLFSWVEAAEHRAIGGDQAIEVGGVYSMHACDEVAEIYDANHQKEVSGTYQCSATSIKLEATAGIELKCGGSSIVLSSGAIFITGPIVNINSGSGPPVAPVGPAGMSPGPAEDASAADRSDPGSDTRYTATREPPKLGTIDADVEGHKFADTWIEFQLVDAAENPIPDEPYRVTLPDETVQEGRTDAEGLCRFEGLDVGLAYIQLPNRQDAAWKKLRVEWSDS